LLFWMAVTGCVVVAWWWFGLSPVLAFWSGCVLTRPLGTSVAFCLTDQPGTTSGVWVASATLAIGVVACVSYLAISHRDVATLDLSSAVPNGTVGPDDLD
jgi:uncharacterized membrane-anchored protein